MEKTYNLVIDKVFYDGKEINHLTIQCDNKTNIVIEYKDESVLRTLYNAIKDNGMNVKVNVAKKVGK